MLRTLGKILKWAILLPVLAAIVLLAVANGHDVTVHLNPFDTGDPVLRLELPLYQIGFLLFVVGALVGGLVSWISHRKYRQRARGRREEAALWQARAERPEHRQAEASSPSSQASAFLPRPERG